MAQQERTLETLQSDYWFSMLHWYWHMCRCVDSSWPVMGHSRHWTAQRQPEWFWPLYSVVLLITKPLSSVARRTQLTSLNTHRLGHPSSISRYLTALHPT